MEHFETATRDPAFFRLHKYMDGIFKLHKDNLPAYTKAELDFAGVHLNGVDIEGELVTYFDDFEFDLKMAVDTSQSVDMMDVKAVASRLNHKDFTYNFHIKNDDETQKNSVIRVFLCPQKTNQGVMMTYDVGRWHCIEMDKFWKKLRVTVTVELEARNIPITDPWASPWTDPFLMIASSRMLTIFTLKLSKFTINNKLPYLTYDKIR